MPGIRADERAGPVQPLSPRAARRRRRTPTCDWPASPVCRRRRQKPSPSRDDLTCLPGSRVTPARTLSLVTPTSSLRLRGDIATATLCRSDFTDASSACPTLAEQGRDGDRREDAEDDDDDEQLDECEARGPPPAACAASCQLMRSKTLKIGMYSAMIMPPMSDPSTTIISGSMRRRELLGGRLDLLVVELRDLLEHRVERAGVLTDRHHLHHHRREDRVLRQRPGQRVPATAPTPGRPSSRARSTRLPLVSPTMSRACRMRHAGVDHGAEVAREAGDGDLAGTGSRRPAP